MAEAPPLHGEDKEEIAEIEGVTADAYTSVAQQRASDRKRREQAEDRREDHKPKFIQPQKEPCQKHTGTGLVERRVGLLKLTMAKCATEAARFSITPEMEELASEAAMAHNLTLNVGGYSPSMMVFGILPRGYLDAEEVPLSVASADLDQSPFERAVRLRQIALQAAQAAILEDRIVRAGRTRPEKLDLSGLVAGSSQIEIYRDDGNYGWRGPAWLLKINDAEGTCVVEYQGRNYLMSLRHIRPYRGSFFSHCHSDNMEQICEQDMLDLQQMVEASDPYKLLTLAHVLKTSSTASHEWVKIPAEMQEKDIEYLNKARGVASFFSKKELRGIRFGRAVKQIYAPKYSKGVLISWPKNSKQYITMEHNGDSHLTLKKVMHVVLEDICHLCLFYYTFYSEESPPAQITTRQPTAMDSTAEAMDVAESRKRDGPESRTIVLAPEKKKARYEYADDSGPSEQELLLKSLWWMTQRPQKIKYQSDGIWFNDQSLIMQYNRQLPWTSARKQPKHFLFHFHGKTEEILSMDLRTTEVFRVDSDTDVLTEEQLAKHWQAFELSGFAELKQFVDEDAFFKLHISQVTEEMVIVDCTWVRKFKCNPDRSMKAKSRLCARGFLDPQKTSMPTRSTTATRLSQRILVSLAAAMSIESLDVSGAFLKGLSFDQVRKKLRERGVISPRRLVAIIPPAKIWRHLAKMDKRFEISESQMGDYLLGCNKPVYGLNDAPLAWQLCLHDFVEELGGRQSVFDENMFFWKTPSGQLETILTTHVDDIAIATVPKKLEELHMRFTKKFGKVTREQMPFQHCGMVYEKVAQGYRTQQYDFTDSLKMTDIKDDKDEERSLTKDETTQYRSILGGLLWLTATRMDLIAEVCRLQTFVTQAKVKHLRMAHAIVKRAQDKKYKDLGIVYRRLPPRAGWRLACVPFWCS
eukprot:g26143.t1